MTLLKPDGPATLVWRDSETSWDAAKREIVFSRGNEDIRLSTGDHISLGASQLPSSPEWVREPHDSCPKEILVVDDP